MTRLFVAVVVGVALVVVYDRASGTSFAPWLGLLAVGYAVVCSFVDDRAQRNLQAFERRERLRDERRRA